MIVELKGYDLYLGVLTLKGVYVDNPKSFLKRLEEDFRGLEFQALNLANVAGFKHILAAVLTALEAIKHGLNVAKSLPMEILVRASTQRQITRALEVLGVKEGVQNIALMVLAEEFEPVENALKRVREHYSDYVDDWIIEEDRSRRIMEIYEISEENVKAEAEFPKSRWEAVKNLIVERVALTLTI